MNNQQPLIYTQQKLLPRVIDIILTILAWAGFAWLIISGIDFNLRHYDYSGLSGGWTSVDAIVLYILAALLNGAFLIIWAKYNQFRFRGVERRKHRPPLKHQELADSFAMDAAWVEQLQEAKTQVIYFDEDGHVVDNVTRS